MINSLKVGYYRQSVYNNIYMYMHLCTGYKITTTSEKEFLSWQTRDLLRLMYYGFKNLCADFVSAHPGYTVYPVRLNGSAVETFFSQVKHATSGQLSSINYATARQAEVSPWRLQKCISLYT